MNGAIERNKNGRIPWKNIWLIGAGLFAFVFIQQLTAFIAVSALDLPSMFPSDGGSLIIGTVCTYVLGAGACALLLFAAERTETPKKSAGAITCLEVFCIAAATVYLGNIAGVAVTTALGGSIDIIGDSLGGDAFLTFVVTVAVAPVVEEMIFRKMLIPRLLPFGERTAVIFSALAFALMHGNFLQFFYALGFGVLCGYIFVRTGRAVYTVALHIIINIFGGIIPSLLNRDGVRFYIYIAAVLAVAVVGTVLLCRRIPKLRLDAPEKGGVVWKSRNLLYLNPFSLAYLVICAVFFVKMLLT